MSPTSQDKPMNVLLIVSDDLNCHLNCYGKSSVVSPNIDRLAAKGVKFERAYCQYPLCGPTRASFLTGLRPDTTGVNDGVAYLRDNLPNVVTMPQCFRQHGYHTARVGKVFHDARTTPDDPCSWDIAIEPHTSLTGWKGKTTQFTPDVQGLRLGQSLEAEGGDEDQRDGLGAAQAIRLLEQRPTDKPFFLGVGYRMPHINFAAPKRYFDMYDPGSLELPELRPDAWDNVPDAAVTLKDFNYGIGEAEWRMALRAYYAAVTFMDALVGKLVAALDRLGLADNTIVVFMSDNGWHVGEHGLWHKFTLFDESTRVPLVAYVPGAKANGRTCRRLVEYVDILPTLAELCGITTPEVEGASFVPLLAEPEQPWKKAAFSQQKRGDIMGYSIVTERWCYNEWDQGRAGTELYDHESDPGEFTNLAGDPTHAATVEEMSSMLHAGWRAALPSSSTLQSSS